MLQPVAFINRELARWLPVLPAPEVKALLALMLQANVAGFLRTAPEAFAARLGCRADEAVDLLDRLVRRRLIAVEPSGPALVVVIRGFLGGRGAPRDAVVSNLGA